MFYQSAVLLSLAVDAISKTAAEIRYPVSDNVSRCNAAASLLGPVVRPYAIFENVRQTTRLLIRLVISQQNRIPGWN